MLLGGYPNDARKAAFILHMANMTWTQKASMRLGRQELACGTVRNLQTGKEEVVAVGGGDLSSEIYSVEDDSWRDGPMLPGPVRSWQNPGWDEYSFLVNQNSKIYKVYQTLL